ncbi:MAG: nuclear transport factor 2 family protein [Sphingobacteriales bacterium]|nr:nuclear transport factor 2 family protein [Sphingobacteriales bacterium]
MKKTNKIILTLLFPVILLLVFSTAAKSQPALPKYERTVSKEFYDNIVYLDSIFFDAYNKCNLARIDSLVSENLEFYHDRGGLTTSKKEILEALQKNICGKVTRELLPGSIEVYEIPGYGAVEMGYHGFHNNQEKETGPTHFAKFVEIWKLENGKWKMTRVISLH